MYIQNFILDFPKNKLNTKKLKLKKELGKFLTNAMLAIKELIALRVKNCIKKYWSLNIAGF